MSLRPADCRTCGATIILHRGTYYHADRPAAGYAAHAPDPTIDERAARLGALQTAFDDLEQRIGESTALLGLARARGLDADAARMTATLVDLHEQLEQVYAAAIDDGFGPADLEVGP